MKNLNLLFKKSIYNRKNIEKNSICGCYYCCKEFNSDEIVEFTDEEQTAICPKCGIDAVLCKKDYETIEVLKEMYIKFFKTYVKEKLQ